MARWAILVSLQVVAASLQQEDIGKLIERWRSDEVDVRCRAVEEVLSRWKDWGETELSALGRAEQDLDPEVAALAREARERIQIRRRIGRRLIDGLPGIDRTLWKGGPQPRLDALREAARLWRRWELDRSDLRALADYALEEKWEFDLRELMQVIRGRRVTPYAGLLLPCLEKTDIHPNPSDVLYELRPSDVLYELRPKEFHSELVRCLKHRSAKTRSAAVQILGKMGAVDDIVPLLKDPDGFTRSCAAHALGSLGARERVSELLPLLEDPEDVVRGVALESMAKLDPVKYEARVLALTQDNNEHMRACAVRALGHLRGKKPLERCLALLKDPDQGVRYDAVFALGEMGAREHAHLIADCLRDEDEVIRYAAVDALITLDARKHVPELVDLLERANQPHASSLWNSLLAMGGDEVAKSLAPLLKKKVDAFPQRIAIHVLGELGAVEHAGDIALFLKSDDADLRSAAAGALARLGDVERFDALMRGGDGVIAWDLGPRLAGRQREEFATKMELLEKSEHAEARSAAAVALLRMGRKDRASQLGLLKEFASRELAPNFGGVVSGPVLDALAQLHEPKAYDELRRPRVLAHDIDTFESLQRMFPEMGLSLHANVAPDFWGRVGKGTRTTPHLLLNRLQLWQPDIECVVLEGGRVLLLSQDDALDHWRRRLSRE